MSRSSWRARFRSARSYSFAASSRSLPLLVVSFYTHGPRSLVRTTHPWLHLRRSIAGTTGDVPELRGADATAIGRRDRVQFCRADLRHDARGPSSERKGRAASRSGSRHRLRRRPHDGRTARHVSADFATGSPLGATMALSAALFSAFVVVFIRQMSATETSEAIVFYFMVVCAAAGAVTMIWDFAPLNWAQIAWLVLCGVLGGIGQVCMTYCYRYAEPSFLAPFDYVAMIWAVALGYFIFAEIPETHGPRRRRRRDRFGPLHRVARTAPPSCPCRGSQPAIELAPSAHPVPRPDRLRRNRPVRRARLRRRKARRRRI